MTENATVAQAKKIVGIPGWEPWKFVSIFNGTLVVGALCHAITRGPRKGQPNFRKPEISTQCVVFVPNVFTSEERINRISDTMQDVKF